jgi:hypothetical protein
VTARDISSNNKQVSYSERYETPTNQNANHPQDDTFFISKVDFTGRKLSYSFSETNPLVQASSRTVFFKIGFLYMDVPVQGIIWDGLGLKIAVDTSGAGSPIMTVNGKSYTLPNGLKKWTCTQVAVADSAVYIAGESIPRTVSGELLAIPISCLSRWVPFPESFSTQGFTKGLLRFKRSAKLELAVSPIQTILSHFVKGLTSPHQEIFTDVI